MVQNFTTHPTRNQLEAFAQGELSAADQQTIEAHLEQCKTCCGFLETISNNHQKKPPPSTSPTVSLADREEEKKSNTNALAIPETLMNHPRYEIMKRLGVGGMGVVYQAEHRLMGRMVALKVINNRLLQNSSMVDRFRLEIKAAARLTHRNIVTAFDAEQAGDVHFFVMEFIEGVDLSTLVSRSGQLSILHACRYIMQAARGVQHAHEQGMVHRDIKPQNLMRTSKGIIKVLDFGLARLAGPQDADNSLSGLTGEGTTLGTPDYIAPEQARDSRQADVRSDIYSLGCTFYYLLTGKVPFPTGTVMEKVIAHCESAPEPIQQLRNDIPDAVVAIVEKMISKKPADRFQTPKEVAEALKPFAIKQEEKTELHSNTVSPLTINSTNKTKGLPKISAWLSGYQKPVLILLLGVIAVIASAIIFLRNNETGNPQTTNNQEDNPPQTTSEWIDLTQQINLSEHALAGEWEQNENGFHVEAREWARLVLPGEPPAEYDFEVQFTRQSGTQSIAIFFVMGEGQASFELDTWNEHLTGIQLVNRQDIRDNPTRILQPLQNNQHYTALVKVRRGRVETFLNGERLNVYESDGSDLSLSANWSLGNIKSLGVGAYNSETTFHRIRIQPAK
ncbi:Serine/threonine protein kinase PrkC, regulator of stationary phase [hydrothermal vent metagenome]|uniref:Serine/threonine protein kinase PrkC, regulator of stationary phase n=1 Tax=hydrothermal vent metagenome TaxID=652676 RepID=A0A3B1DCY3_9ZZZZ